MSYRKCSAIHAPIRTCQCQAGLFASEFCREEDGSDDEDDDDQDGEFDSDAEHLHSDISQQDLLEAATAEDGLKQLSANGACRMRRQPTGIDRSGYLLRPGPCARQF